jgi:hypothetical protein
LLADELYLNKVPPLQQIGVNWLCDVYPKLDKDLQLNGRVGEDKDTYSEIHHKSLRSMGGHVTAITNQQRNLFSSPRRRALLCGVELSKTPGREGSTHNSHAVYINGIPKGHRHVTVPGIIYLSKVTFPNFKLNFKRRHLYW